MTTATATHEGFTDSTGRSISFEDGVRAAARCVMNQHETAFVEDLMRFNLSPDEVLEWIVYPDTGVFADDVR